MTAILNRPLTDPAPDPATNASLLRFALRADSTFCAALGLLIAMTADPLARITGLTATAEWLVGAALVAYGALLYALAAARDIRRVGIAIVVGNVAFVVATLGLAWLQYRGVRRLV